MDDKERQFIETVEKGLKLLGLLELDKKEKEKLLIRFREIESK